MLRGMVFLDYLNFDISFKKYYINLKQPAPRIDYSRLMFNISRLKRDTVHTKSYIFAPRPCDFLLNDPYYENYYNWIRSLESFKYIDVVYGRSIARPTPPTADMDINDKSTYSVTEKGTDLNLGLYALSGAFHNSYDIAFVVSGDTDYISLYSQLKNYGKLVAVVVVEGQPHKTLVPYVDDYYTLNDSFFSRCLLKPKGDCLIL